MLAACAAEGPAPSTADSGAAATDESDGAGGSDGADGSSTTPPPYGEDLVQDGGFEQVMAPLWEQAGGCAQVASSDLHGPHAGAGFLAGARGSEVPDCLATQHIDLLALGFDPGVIDAGRVALDLEAWLASRDPAGPYDDQVLVRVRYLDAADQERASLETLIGASEDWALRGATGLLPAETRALSVEVEGRFREPPDNDAYADDVQLWLREVEPASPGLTLAPLLQDHRTDAMRLAWETDGNLAWNAVEHGDPATPDALDRVQTVVRTIAVDDTHYVHVAEVDDLTAAEVRAYRVRSGETVSDVYTLRAAPADDADEVLIGWLADNQEGWERFRVHLAHLSARAPDLLVVPGDIISDHDRLVEWREWWWGPLVDVADFGSTTPVLIARGNHDRHHPYGYAYVQVPGNGIVYSYRFGPVFVVALDSQILPDHMPGALNQRSFLEAALASEAARGAAFRVVTFHNGPFTNVSGNGTDGYEGARESWVPLFESGGVDLVITGHYHSYQRGESGGVTYVTVGGGGSTLLADTWDHWDFIDVVDLTWQYSTMHVQGGQLRWETRDLDDALIDAFELTGGPR